MRGTKRLSSHRKLAGLTLPGSGLRGRHPDLHGGASATARRPGFLTDLVLDETAQPAGTLRHIPHR